jgi:N-acetylglutamate synthase-like GNAT family acetyltransferase
MSEADHRLRRATLDDLTALADLWRQSQLPVADLESRFTQFQLLESSNGKLIGALGLQIQGLHGNLHTEALAYPDPENELRGLLWDRIQSVAKNHGLARLWTLDPNSFWYEKGFKAASSELLERLPSAFGDPKAPWTTLELRPETALVSMEKDFELFRITQKEETDKVLRQARVFKFIATLIAVVFFVIVVMGIVYLIRHNQLLRR